MDIEQQIKQYSYIARVTASKHQEAAKKTGALDKDDLYAVGLEAIWYAIKKVDDVKPYNMAGWLKWHTSNKVVDVIRDNGVFKRTQMRMISDSEKGKEQGESTKKTVEGLLATQLINLDAYDNHDTIEDPRCPDLDQKVYEKERMQMFLDMTDRIPERHRVVSRMVMGGQTLASIGLTFGFTEGRASQVYKEARQYIEEELDIIERRANAKKSNSGFIKEQTRV